MTGEKQLEMKKPELAYLLRFFSQDQLTQWEQVPDDIGHVWVHTGDVDTDTEVPVELLMLILFSLTNGTREYNFQSSELIEVLYDIKVLSDYIYESQLRFILTKRAERVDVDRFWSIMQRLCTTAISYEEIKAIPTEGVSFDYLLERYTSPWSKK